MDILLSHFEAWKVFRAGSREVTEAVVAPGHQGPSPSLAAALESWPGRYYWPARDHSRLVLIRAVGQQRYDSWLVHAALLLLTASCALGAGAALAHRLSIPMWHGLGGGLLTAGRYFLDFYHASWEDLLAGWSFAAPLLGILLVHEMGHYLAARRYAIDVSPPVFLPVPPAFSPIGSLGAFIRVRSPVLDRRQLLDVGAAGPLAGFVAAVAVLLWGYSVSDPSSHGLGVLGTYVEIAGEPVRLGESYLTQLVRDWLLPGAESVKLSLPAFAGWVGIFVTGLNLLPFSQLDGGHVLYGLLGRRQALVGLLGMGWLLYLSRYSTTWLIWVLLALALGGGRLSHPSVVDPGRPIPASRRMVGWLCILVFGLCFVPIPFRE